MLPPALSSSCLTEAQWARIEPLLPQNGGRGKRWQDLRRLIDGMLWVHASGASWRDLPEEEYGPWQTVYSRHNRWRKVGLWQRIAELLWCQRGDH
jgi:transposase